MKKEKKHGFKQAKDAEEVFGLGRFHLERQDYTVKEMQDKLIRNTPNQEWIDSALQKLIRFNWLKTDEKFAAHFTEREFSKQLGASFIRQTLIKRGIPKKVAEETVDTISEQLKINHKEMAEKRLMERFESFSDTTKEALYNEMIKFGFSSSDVSYALSVHPAQDTLRTKLAVKAEKLDLEKEILKLAKKGKGRNMIRQELKAKLLDVSTFDDVVYRLEMAGDIDFYASCKQQLGKKRYDLSDYNEKSKAYAFLARRGFTRDEIKEAFA